MPEVKCWGLLRNKKLVAWDDGFFDSVAVFKHHDREHGVICVQEGKEEHESGRFPNDKSLTLVRVTISYELPKEKSSKKSVAVFRHTAPKKRKRS